MIKNLNINKYSTFINTERLKNNPVELSTNDILNLIKIIFRELANHKRNEFNLNFGI